MRLGREVAANVIKFLDEEAPVRTSATAKAGDPTGKALRIDLEEVTFTYPGADEPAIRNLTMSLLPNETVALIGKSGSGKTTVTNLLLRTLDPDSGVIKFDGIPEQDLSLDWIRKQIALVPQDPFLFYGTIADNLRMAKEGASDEELMQALAAAETQRLCRRFPRWPRY